MNKLNDKRIALRLLVVMICIFVCSSCAPKTMFNAMREAIEMQAYQLEMTWRTEKDGEETVFEINGAMDRENMAAEMDVSASYGGTDYEIGTLIMADGVLYFDADQLFDAVGITEDIFSMLLEREDIVIDAFAWVPILGLDTNASIEAQMGASEALTRHLIAALEQGAGKEPGMVNGKDGSWHMELDLRHPTPGINGIQEYVDEHLDAMWDEFMVLASPVYEKERYHDLTDVFGDMLLNLDFRFSGKEEEQVCESTLEVIIDGEDTETVMTLEILMEEGRAEIQTPEEYTNLIEVAELLSRFRQSHMGADSAVPDVDYEVETEKEPDMDTSTGNNLHYGTLFAEDGTYIEVFPGDGFSYDARNSRDKWIYLDYDSVYYSGVAIYLYDLGDTYTFTPDDYYTAELQERLDDTEKYKNADAAEYDCINVGGYDVWYSVLTYEHGEDTRYGLYSFSDLNRTDVAVCAEMEAWSVDEWNAMFGDGVEPILEEIYSNVFVYD